MCRAVPRWPMVMVAVVVVVAAACSAAAPETSARRSAPPSPRPSPPAAAASQLPAEAQAMLDAHNRSRAQHCAAPLTWSTELASTAQRWADHLAGSCGFEHSSGPFGENLAAGTGPLTAEAAVALWFQERSGYDFARPGFSMTTGHFTQLVWRDTQRLGCGWSSCGTTQIWVCNYDPPGNVEGQWRQQVLPSSCDRRAATSSPREVVFHGACDASGAVPLSHRHMVVADDEDNVLRVYDADVGGAPLSARDVSAELHLPRKGKKKLRAPELDLEAATRLGDRAFWLTSHGRDKKGELAPERLRLFATNLEPTGLRVVGTAYDQLVEDLTAAPGLGQFELVEAAQRAPKAHGGLNIEGLTAAPDGTVILAFRNPVPRGKALLTPVLNLADLVSGGGPAQFGAPILLDLGGRGVRSLSWWRGRYLIIAGDTGSRGPSQLYAWDGAGKVTPSAVDLASYNPEGFFTPEHRHQVLLLSDDGERLIDGVACKKLKDPARRRFRGVWVDL